MPSTIQLKRAAVAGKVPLVSDLASGELAVNTRDAALFMKKTVGGVDSVVRVGAEMSPLIAAALKATTWGNFLDAMEAPNLIYDQPAVAAAGQTVIDFTGAPSYIDHLHINFAGLSTSGTSGVLVQLGDSGGIEMSGYNATCMNTSGTAISHTSSTAGFLITPAAAADALSGRITLQWQRAEVWTASGAVRRSASAMSIIAGDKALTDTLTRIRITTAAGTDTFDTGSVSLSWE